MVLGSGIRDPGSGIWKKPIPDPGSRGQKAPDPGSGFATLLGDTSTKFLCGLRCFLLVYWLKSFQNS